MTKHRHRHPAAALPARLALALAPGVSACLGGSDEARAPSTAIRDSAGVPIVESSAAALRALPRWTVAEPELVLGAAQGDPGHEFSHIVGGFLLPDGSVVIGDEETREIRVFDRSGALLRSFGGRGEGPGEFRFLQGLGLRSDGTISASGWPFGFMSRFTPDGDYVGGAPIGPFWPGQTSFILPDGTLLIDYYEGGHGNNVEVWAAQDDAPYFRAAGQLIRVFEDGRQDTLRPVEGQQMFKSGVWRRDLWIGRQPYGPVALTAVAGERVFVAESSQPEIEVRRLDGTLERLLRWEAPAVPISDADRERIAAGERHRLRQPERAPHVDRWLAAVVYPDRKPPLEALAADPEGRVWARVPTPAAEATDRWIAFAEDGPVAQIRLPADAYILEMRREHVLLVLSDALDVERVELRPLTAAPGGSSSARHGFGARG